MSEIQKMQAFEIQKIQAFENLQEWQELVAYKAILDKWKQNLQDSAATILQQAFEELYQLFRQNIQEQKVREAKWAEECSIQKMQLVSKIDNFFEQQRKAINQDTPQQWIERFNQLKELTGKGIMEIVLQDGPTVEQLQFEINQLKEKLEIANRKTESLLAVLEKQLPVFIAE